MKLNNVNIGIRDIKKHQWSIVASIVVLAALTASHFILIAPIMAKKEVLDARIRQQQNLIAKYEQKLKQGRSIQANLTKHEGELRKIQKKLFRGTDPYQLAASLGDLLSSKGGHGAQKLDIKTYQVLASKEHGLYQEVHLRFNLMTNIEGLHYFLSRVRNSQFAILVKEINIQKILRNKGPDLVVNVILAALMEKGGKS